MCDWIDVPGEFYLNGYDHYHGHPLRDFPYLEGMYDAFLLIYREWSDTDGIDLDGLYEQYLKPMSPVNWQLCQSEDLCSSMEDKASQDWSGLQMI